MASLEVGKQVGQRMFQAYPQTLHAQDEERADVERPLRADADRLPAVRRLLVGPVDGHDCMLLWVDGDQVVVPLQQ
jgi:hypothetical protein